MISEYRLVVRMTFGSLEDRDNWYSKIKTAISNVKSTAPAYKICRLEKDDYQIVENASSENL